MTDNQEDLVYRLRKRAEIRRQIPSRKSVQEGKSDRMADLLDEAAAEIERLKKEMVVYNVFWSEEYVGHHLLASFSTREKAEKYLEKKNNLKDGETYYISEYELDKE